MAARPGAVRGFVGDANFWDVGTPADYWRTSQAFLATQIIDLQVELSLFVGGCFFRFHCYFSFSVLIDLWVRANR